MNCPGRLARVAPESLIQSITLCHSSFSCISVLLTVLIRAIERPDNEAVVVTVG